MRNLLIALCMCLHPAGAIAVSSEVHGKGCEVHVGDRQFGPGEVRIGASRDGIDLLETEGYADLEHRLTIQPDTVFRIASLTKQFTSIAILVLTERGTLALDGKLAAYLPFAPKHWHEITLRQLLSHTSGLTADMSPVSRVMKQETTPDDLVRRFFSYPLTAPPGSEWRYSNLNYWILGLVIENATDMSYAEFVQKNVLLPSGLTRTRYGSHRNIVAGRAVGYEIDDTGCIQNARYFSSSIGYSAGGFISTPLEMRRWYAALSDGRIVSRKTLDLALTPVKTSSGVSSGYGLGWYVEEVDGHRVGHHGGTSIGFSAYIYWAREPFAFGGVFRNWSGIQGEPQAAALEIMKGLIGRS